MGVTKRGFSPDLEVLECGRRVLKRQNNAPSASAAFEALGCRRLVFLVLAPACAALRFGLLLSTLSWLTQYSLEAALDGSNFRAAPNFGTLLRRIWLQVPSFPLARPRMCRREVWVAALNLIEAHSHTL